MLPVTNGVREYQVLGIAPYPHAYPLFAQADCAERCELDETSVADLRRSRDIALVYVGNDSDGFGPGESAEPLRVVTEVTTPAADSATMGASSVYLDIDRDFRLGSTVEALLVGYGDGALREGYPPEIQESRGRFDLGEYWDVGCEQIPYCGATVNRRNRCPTVPFAPNSDFFEDRVLRVLDVAQDAWTSSFLRGSSGSPLFVVHGAPPGSLSTFHGDEVSVFGVLSDVEHGADRDGDRVAAYVAPTFWKDTGSWLAERLLDFDGDCRPDLDDKDPTEASDTGDCAPSSADWALDSLDDVVAPAPRPPVWFHQGNAAAVLRDDESVELFRVGADSMLYRTLGSAGPDHFPLTWSAWGALERVEGLRGELAATTKLGVTYLAGLTETRGLCLVSRSPSGEIVEQAPLPRPEGGFTSAPALVVPPPSITAEPGALDLFVRGSGAELLRFRYRAGEWLAPQTLGLGITSAPVAIVAPGSDGIELLARSREFRLQRWWISAESGPSWEAQDLGPIDGTPTGVSWGIDRLDLLSRGASGALSHRSRSGEEWSDWNLLGGAVRSEITAVALPNVLQVYGFADLDRLIRFRSAD